MLNILAETTGVASEVLEAVKDVQGFYNDAWGSLLTLVGIVIGVFVALFALIGLLLPWLAERARERRFELSKEQILGEIQKSTEAAKLMEQNTLSQITKARDDFQEEHRKTSELIHETQRDAFDLTGATLYAQGMVARQFLDPAASAAYFALAVGCHAHGGLQPPGLSESLDRLVRCLDNETIAVRVKNNPTVMGILGFALGRIKDAKTAGEYAPQVEKLQQFLAGRQKVEDGGPG